MIISPTRQCVFIHLHKCAGTSVEQALATQLGPNDLVIGSTPSGERLLPYFEQVFKLHKHSTALQARDFLGAERYRSWYSFAFARHPVWRLRSLYTYVQKLIAQDPLGPAEQRRYAATGQLPDREIYTYYAVQAALRSADFNAFVLDELTWRDPGAAPQWRSLCDEHGTLMVNFIAKVERMATDWQQVEARLKLSAPMGHDNQSAPPGDTAALALSEDAIKRLRLHYAPDFALLGYNLSELLVPGA